jgi:chloramphenicol O-acetyltransferase
VKYIQIDDDVFKVIVHFVFNCKQEKFNKWMAKKFDVETGVVRGAGGCFFSFEVGDITEYCVWIETFDWKIKEQGWFVHELVHTSYTILKDRGIELNDETEEVFAYFHTYLFEEVYKKLTKGG